MASFYWVFLNRKHQIQSPKLSQRRAERLVQQLRYEDIKHWWAWNPSFTEWIPLRNLVVEVEGKYRLSFRPTKKEQTDTISIVDTRSGVSGRPRPSERKAKRIVIEETRGGTQTNWDQQKPLSNKEEVVFKKVDFNGDTFTWSNSPPAPDLFGEPSDRRGAERFSFKIEVLIMNPERSFRTTTENISMTGAILEKPIPNELIIGPFEVVFITKMANEIERIVFKGKIVGSLDDPRRLTFTELPEESRIKLANLIRRLTQGQYQRAG